ncbi:thioredoxin family protein [Neptunomonas marina]|uniref:Thioredoxin family protein n=2 Tax=Neptunomonas marina TaxID=1815562 RepID=A0A437QA04_9GAMM|nr:thioredoxin family protein [Neptunomonas marina]
MKFTVYGSGCAKCEQLCENTQNAAQMKGVECVIEKITEMSAIIDAGILRTPALAIDDEIVLEGHVANSEEIAALI